MAFEKDIAGGGHVDGEFVDFAGDEGGGGGVGGYKPGGCPTE